MESSVKRNRPEENYLSKKNIEDIYPLSPMQQGMLFHSLYDPGSGAYSEQFSCSIKGDLDCGLLEDAWNVITDAYPVFRTVFNWKDLKSPFQIVLKTRPVAFSVIDVTDGPEGIVDDFIEMDRGFDLAKGPLMRITVLETAPREFTLVWSYHHILIDGWCLSLIMGDLFIVYEALRNDRPVPPINRPPYKEYISWLSRQDRDKASSFWKVYFDGISSPTPLPRDNETTDLLRIRQEEFSVGEPVTRRIENCAREMRITMNTMVQAAWAVVLSAYSSLDDVIFGMTVSGRPHELAGSDEIVGLFINSLPVRARVDRNCSFESFVKELSSNISSVMDYEYSFLPEIKTAGGFVPSDNLFDSLVVFENYPLEQKSLELEGGLSISGFTAKETTSSDITLICMPGDELTFRVLYNSEKFKVDTIERMMSHFLNLISSIPDRSSDAIKDIDLLDAAERTLVLETFNDTSRPYETGICVHELFERQVQKTPDKEAVTFGGKALTYRSLDEYSTMLAHYLAACGVGPGTPVALMMERCLELETALLGVLKAGGAYVPMGVDFPDTRVDYILEETSSPVILTLERFRHRFSGKEALVVCLDSMWADIESAPLSGRLSGASPEDLAYIIYTSGSTGEPKGVECLHKGLVNRLFWMQEEYSLGVDDVVLQKTPYTFDVSVWEFFWPVMTGARLHMLEPAAHKDPHRLIEVIRDEKITTMHFVPSMLGAFLYSVDENDVSGLGSLRRVICSGEALLADHRKRFFSLLDSELHNLYGPTEASIDVTSFSCSPDDASETIPIGRPVANTKVYILDGELKPVPVGVTGQIFLWGVQLARGYLAKPEKTADAFIPSPFGRIYATGDLGCWRPDGNIVYHGRMDHQVKIRGNRIELGEVAGALCLFDGIVDCVVIDTGEPRYLAAYYVAENELPVGELRKHLGVHLPEYMIPSRFMRLEALPLNANGKIDRKALPAIRNLRPESVGSYVQPAEGVETAVAGAFREVLGLARVGATDNFFELGGDSISSLQVVGKLKKLGYELSPRDIFERQTVEALASVVREDGTMTISQETVSGSSPLTPVQRWFFDLELENPHHFNQGVALRPGRKIDEKAFHSALCRVVGHHDVLLSTFSGKRQHFNPGASVPGLTVHQVKSAEDKKTYEASLHASLDIEKGPVFAAAVLREEASDEIVLAAHHLVIDGISWRILLEDLAGAYLDEMGEAEWTLPAKTTSYRDWAGMLEEYAASGDLEEEASFWEKTRGSLVVPTDSTEGPNDVASSFVTSVELDEGKTSLLMTDANRAYRTSAEELLVTALVRTLREWTGSESIRFDFETHGRETIIDGVDISRTVGWFTSIFPVVLGPSAKSPIIHVKECLRAIPQRGISFGVLKYLRNFDGPINTGVSFNYLGGLVDDNIDGFIDTDPVRMLGVIDPSNTRANLVDVICALSGGRMCLHLVASANRHRKETIEKLAGSLLCNLEEVIEMGMNPERFEVSPSDFALSGLDSRELDSLYD